MISDMTSAVNLIAMYVQLAHVAGLRGRLYAQGRLLCCAALIAAEADYPQTSQLCRGRILRHNPQHWLGRYASVAEALQTEETLGLVRKAQRRYPPERAEQLYNQLGLNIDSERALYLSDRSFLATTLGATEAEIDPHV